jgi:threonine dehydratase
MALSFANRKPTDTATAETFAGGMAVRVAIPEAVELMLEVVDRMVLVSEAELKRAMRLFQRVTGTLPEGAGAAALAAALKLRRQSEEGAPWSWNSVCLIATGANVDSKLARELESVLSD